MSIFQSKFYYGDQQKVEEKEGRKKQTISSIKKLASVNSKIEICQHSFPINLKNRIFDNTFRAIVNQHPQIKEKEVLRNKTPLMINNICA